MFYVKYQKCAIERLIFMSSVNPVNNFYQKLETYKQYLYKNRPANMTDSQLNEQINRYMTGLQHDEFKLSNKENGREFARNLAMEKNGQNELAEQLQEKQFAQSLENEQKFIEASNQPREVLGRPVDKNRADAIKERQSGSQLKGEMKQEAYIRNLEMRAEAGNASPDKKAKMKRRARKLQSYVDKQRTQRSPEYQAYQDKVNTRRIERRIRNLGVPSNTLEETVKKSTKMSLKAKLGLIATALGVIGGIFYLNSGEKTNKSNQLDNVA